MSDQELAQARELLAAVENLCGEANEGARLAASIFKGPEQREVRRALARCMELMEEEVLPPLRSKFPQLQRQS
jgi:hypothetical protein